MNNPQAVLDQIAAIRKLRNEQECELQKLEMQARIALQGVDVEQVASYGYTATLDNRVPERFGSVYGAGFTRVKYWREAHPVYNYVTLKNGERVNIEPVAIPAKLD